MLQYGEEAIKEGMGSGGGGGGMSDIFDLFGGGGRRQQPRERRGENVVHKLKVSLEEMYSGGSGSFRYPETSSVTLALAVEQNQADAISAR